MCQTETKDNGLGHVAAIQARDDGSLYKVEAGRSWIDLGYFQKRESQD